MRLRGIVRTRHSDLKLMSIEVEVKPMRKDENPKHENTEIFWKVWEGSGVED